MPKLTRRQFVALTASSLSLCGGFTLAAGTRSASNSHLYALLAEVVADPHAAARLGQSYLEQHHDIAGIVSLEQGLLQLLTGNNARDHQVVATCLQQLYHADFTRHDSVTVGGWILPRNEARLFALIAHHTPTIKPS